MKIIAWINVAIILASMVIALVNNNWENVLSTIIQGGIILPIVGRILKWW